MRPGYHRDRVNLARRVRRLLSGSWLPSQGTPSVYVSAAPDPQNALDIFRDEWASRLPPPLRELRAGRHLLFEDARIRWLDQEIGGVKGRSVLELGPLEGGHSYMLETLGAREVVAVEVNTRAYLRCLVVKELLGLRRVRFLFGDIRAYLREGGPSFDVCVASGVLYHVQNPVELIDLMSRRCAGFLFLWTHYYDPEVILRERRLARKFGRGRPAEQNGFRHTLYPYHYREALEKKGFCGGAAGTTAWLGRDDILRALAWAGFEDVRVGFEEPGQKNGPAFAVLARKAREREA